MSDAASNGEAYWKAEAIKHERRYRRIRDEKADLEKRLLEATGERDLDAAMGAIGELAKAAAEEWPSLMDELEQLRGKAETLDKDATVADLRRQLVTRDRRDEWMQAVKDQLAEGVPLEDVWAKAGYEPGDEPAGEAIKELVGKAREAAPYLFRPPAGAGEAPGGAKASPTDAAARRPAAGLGGGQGAPDRGPLKTVISKADTVSDPDWAKRPGIREAAAAGLLVVQD